MEHITISLDQAKSLARCIAAAVAACSIENALRSGKKNNLAAAFVELQQTFSYVYPDEPIQGISELNALAASFGLKIDIIPIPAANYSTDPSTHN